MIWHYNNAETFQLNTALWDKYTSVFTNVWAATAFKGATSSCQILPINKYHISNHEAWLSELSLQHNKIGHFRGIALTGWSRLISIHLLICMKIPKMNEKYFFAKKMVYCYSKYSPLSSLHICIR